MHPIPTEVRFNVKAKIRTLEAGLRPVAPIRSRARAIGPAVSSAMFPNSPMEAAMTPGTRYGIDGGALYIIVDTSEGDKEGNGNR